MSPKTLRTCEPEDDSIGMELRCASRFAGGKVCRRIPIMTCENGHPICRAHFIRIGLEDPAPFACTVCGAYCKLNEDIVAAFRDAEAPAGRERIDLRV